MYKGIFISFEGPDGSGKTTQIKLLAKHLEEAGYEVLLTREPGGTVISEKIRNIILDPNNGRMAGTTEALLYAASRAQLVNEFIAPALEAGKVVLCDRFMDSSIAYQGFGRGLGSGVRTINEFAIGSVSPDITFFMDIAPEKGMLRAGERDELDRMELEALEFHEKVYSGYKELSRIYSDRYVCIDAEQSIERIAEQIAAKIDEYILNTGK